MGSTRAWPVPHAYAEAGADVLFVEALRTREQIEQVGRELGGRLPLLANMVEGGKTPLLSIDELARAGFRLAIFPGAMMRVVTRAASDYLATLKRDGTTRNMLDRMYDFRGVNEMIGTEPMLREGDRYDEIGNACRLGRCLLPLRRQHAPPDLAVRIPYGSVCGDAQSVLFQQRAQPLPAGIIERDCSEVFEPRDVLTQRFPGVAAGIRRAETPAPPPACVLPRMPG